MSNTKLPFVFVLMNGEKPGCFPTPENKIGVLMFDSREDAKRYQRKVKPARKHRVTRVTLQQLFDLKANVDAPYFARTDGRGTYWFKEGVTVRHKTTGQAFELYGDGRAIPTAS